MDEKVFWEGHMKSLAGKFGDLDVGRRHCARLAGVREERKALLLGGMVFIGEKWYEEGRFATLCRSLVCSEDLRMSMFERRLPPLWLEFVFDLMHPHYV